MVTIYIPCPHDRGAVKEGVTAPDYHPLSLQEIEELLTIALRTPHERTGNQILERLHQAIPGQTCPRSTEGKTDQIMTDLAELYLKFLGQSDSLGETAVEIFILLS